MSHTPKHITQKSILKESLTKPDIWQAYKYYEKKALFWGFTRISLNKYKKMYWKNHSVPI